MTIGDIIFVCIIAYFGFGVFLAIKLFDGYGGEHEEEKMAATIFFWPIIFVVAIIVLCVLAVFSAFKGLYYIVRDAIKEDNNESEES